STPAPASPEVSLLTEDKVFRYCIETAGKAAGTTSPMLFCGERGTGKGLLARTSHDLSPRKDGPFLALDFRAVPESLLEGILFGTEEGAFTGAADRPGILELAAGGTVYLDEISAIPPRIQDRLQAALDLGLAPRVGSAGTAREVDVKFMSSSSEPLKEILNSGRVRPGLLVRLGVVTLNLPPLRERRGDVPLLTGHFVRTFAEFFGKDARDVSDEVGGAFARHDWPSNVGELKCGIEGAMNAVSLGEASLRPQHFSSTLLGRLFRDDAMSPGSAGSPGGGQRQVHYLHSAAEAERIAAALEAAGGNAAKAARSLKISPQLMNYKLKKFSLKKKITVQVG
ncbi:MAG: sigma 54-interacting transcriptional regulator, partial [Deltaproteobacteria bacterium]|nr:sigma 54-interacting transcriptional regulator [Deltaproteobacteria bacterium]